MRQKSAFSAGSLTRSRASGPDVPKQSLGTRAGTEAITWRYLQMTTTRSANALSRRDLRRWTAAGFVGFSMSGWLERMAEGAAKDPQRKRSCILLWMNGGPSQMDTFDLKPGHANGGPFKEIETNVPGVKISEHLPKLAKHADKLAIIRSMSTKEGDHDRASYQMRTGYLPQGSIQFPPLGALLSKELGSEESDLPNFVSIAPLKFSAPATYGPGFLGPQYAPLVVGDATISYQQGNDYDRLLKVQDLQPSKEISSEEVDARVTL